MIKSLFFFLMIVVSLSIAIAVAALFYYSQDLPSVEVLKQYDPPIVSEVYADNGELIGKFFSEERYVITLNQVPKQVIDAFLAAEDANFYSHHGIDPISIIRASYKNLFSRMIRQGASTITQQVAKTFLLTTERTISRKIKEMILSYQIEKSFDKNYILFLYLNQIYLGHGAYGIEAASRKYFEKHVDELTIAEAAMLAGLPQAPSKYSPYSHMKRAKDRQQYVLQQMYDNGMISKKQRDQSIDEKIVIHSDIDINATKAPYFTETIRKYLVGAYGNEAMLSKGFTVRTTLDPDMNTVARMAIRKGLRELDRRQGFRGPFTVLTTQKEIDTFLCQKQPIDPDGTHKVVVISIDDSNRVALVGSAGHSGRIRLEELSWARPADVTKLSRYHQVEKVSDALRPGYVVQVRPLDDPACSDCYDLVQEPVVQGALLSVSNSSGFVRAMIGGYDFQTSEFNRALQAERQPGSAFKPVIYSAALDNGYTPSTMIIDSPIIYDDLVNAKLWKPKNDGSNFKGDTTLREALVHSMNIPTIKIATDIGLQTIVDRAKSLGVTSSLAPDLSTALGSSVVSVRELLGVYSVFANGGKLVPLVLISEITDKNGRIIERNSEVGADLSLSNQLETIEQWVSRAETSDEVDYDDHEKKSGNENSGSKPEEIQPVEAKLGKLDARQVISPETAYIMTNLLKGVVQYGTGYRVRALDRPVAGKTGTTNDNIDAWFAGYTPQLTTVVWTGFDEKKSLGVNETGGQAAAPIWLEYMSKVLKDAPKLDFPMPSDNLVYVKVDRKTGLLAAANSSKVVYEVFLKGTEPTERSVRIEDKNTGDILFDDEFH